MRALALAAALVAPSLMPSLASAECRFAAIGAGCAAVERTRIVTVKVAPAPPPVEIGEVLERGRYSMLMNAAYYGLPLPQDGDGWVYFRIERDVYRVDYRSMTVLERATGETARNFP